MKVQNVRCMALPKGVPVPHFDTVKEALDHCKGNEVTLVDTLNRYGRQKDSLVEARTFLADQLEDTLGFKMKMDTVTENGESVEVPAETEKEFINRFVKEVATGEFKAPKVTLKSTDPKGRAVEVWNFLQGIIDAHGPFPFDLNAAERAVTVRKPTKTALAAAQTIINNKAEAKGEKNWTNGYDHPAGFRIDPFAFKPFRTPVPAKATPEEAQAVRDTNLKNLAFAIMADLEQEREKTPTNKRFA